MTIFNRIRGFLPGQKSEPRLVRIVTDSTADLPAELIADLDITVVPLQVLFGTESFRDGVDLTAEEFFERLPQEEELPTTSQPSVGEFQQTYQALAEVTDRVLSVHLSAGFSGTVNAAQQAASTLAEECEIEVIDSGTVSMAMGFAVIAAARAARNGADLDTCTRIARSVLGRQRLAVALDTLEYLRRGGRIGRAAGFLGSLLRLKPILTIKDGQASPLSRVRTRKKALDELLRVCLGPGDIEEAIVMYTTDPSDATYLTDAIRERHPDIPIHEGRIGPVIGVHAGPGLIGLAVVLAERPAPEANSEATP
jgi:DegV family protein with EDD domain